MDQETRPLCRNCQYFRQKGERFFCVRRFIARFHDSRAIDSACPKPKTTGGKQ